MANYLTINEADTILGTRLFTTAWENASDSDKTKALTMATEIIDSLNYNGDKTNEDQENEFPRGGDTEIPQSIEKACAEIALVLVDDVDPQFEFENLAVEKHKFESVETTYSRAFAQEHVVAGVPSIVAWRLLLPYLRDVRSVLVQRAT